MPMIQEEIVHVPKSITQEKIVQQHVEQVVKVPIPMTQEEAVHVPTVMQQERIIQQQVEQLVEAPAPMAQEEIATAAAEKAAAEKATAAKAAAKAAAEVKGIPLYCYVAELAGNTGPIGELTQIVGDDLTAMNVERVKKAIADKSCNALLLKVNQISSMTEVTDAPYFNVINGGSHAGNKLAFQEYFMTSKQAAEFAAACG